MALENGKTDFCTECRKWTVYELTTDNYHHMIDGKEYVIPITDAVCAECGAHMSPPGLIDLNTDEYCDWYETRFHKKLNRG